MLLPLIINNADIILNFFRGNFFNFSLLCFGLIVLIDVLPIVVAPNPEESEKIDESDKLEEFEDIYEVKVKKIKKKKNKK